MRLIDADALMTQFDIWEDWDELFVHSIRKEIEHAPTIEPDRSLWFRIGEICVDESKGFISSGRAVEKIRELLREAGRTIERRPK